MTYRLKGKDAYLTLVEAFGPTGNRFFRSFVAASLDGVWSPLAADWTNPFAGKTNVTFADGVAWTNDISHGELIRDGYDQKLEIDPTTSSSCTRARTRRRPASSTRRSPGNWPCSRKHHENSSTIHRPACCSHLHPRGRSCAKIRTGRAANGGTAVRRRRHGRHGRRGGGGGPLGPAGLPIPPGPATCRCRRARRAT